jgi:hypothetical protein
MAAMQKGKKMSVLSARVDDELAQAIKGLAEEDERLVGHYIERVLRRHAIEKGRLPAPQKPAKVEKPEKRGRKP